MVAKEGEGQSPELEELLEAIQSKYHAAIEVILLEPESLELIEQFAKRHWELLRALEHASKDEDKAKIKENPYFSAAIELALQYPGITAGTVRRVLIDKHGFDNRDFDEFVGFDQMGDSSTVIMYFEHMAYLQEHELSSAGKFFTKPRNAEGFNEMNIMQKLDSEIQGLLSNPQSSPAFDQAFSNLDSFKFMKSRSIGDQT